MGYRSISAQRTKLEVIIIGFTKRAEESRIKYLIVQRYSLYRVILFSLDEEERLSLIQKKKKKKKRKDK